MFAAFAVYLKNRYFDSNNCFITRKNEESADDGGIGTDVFVMKQGADDVMLSNITPGQPKNKRINEKRVHSEKKLKKDKVSNDKISPDKGLPQEGNTATTTPETDPSISSEKSKTDNIVSVYKSIQNSFYGFG